MAMRLALCLSHPIQYKVPLMRRLASEPNVDLIVYFYSDTGLVQRKDHYHGTAVAWDIPLLDGYHYEILPNYWPIERRSIAGLGPYLNFSLLFKIVNYDAVIIHSYVYPSDWMAWLTAKLFRVPVVFYGDLYPRKEKGFKSWLRKGLAALMLSGCDAYLAIGSVAKSMYLSEYRCPKEKIFLAPYAVDNDFFIMEAKRWGQIRKELKLTLGILPDQLVVLCVAGMVPKKRQHDLIEAMTNLDVSAKLVLVGHGPLLKEITSLCQRRLPGTIIAGFVNQSELSRYYAVADVFVLPSLFEEFGLVVNEAMCFGLPIIASETVAASVDLIEDGENGYTFPPRDVEALTNRLNLLLCDEELRHKFGRRSRAIISNWNYDRTLEGIMAACTQIVQARREKDFKQCEY